jgi:hypothetical protein
MNPTSNTTVRRQSEPQNQGFLDTCVYGISDQPL